MSIAEKFVRPRPKPVPISQPKQQNASKIPQSVEAPAPPTRSLLDPVLPRDPRTRSQLLYLILISPIIALAAIHSPFNIMNVSGPSMSPIFNAEHNPDTDLPSAHNDVVLVQKGKIFDVNLKRRLARGETDERDDFSRGDIVTFYAPHSPDRIAVKRIVGMPGDIVEPLSGSPGGEESVTVPWNHVWVEGDVDSWQKSMDSNWYGPISQNLIIGKVKAVLTPWYSPKWIDTKTQNWPARRKGRVEEGAVKEAGVDPNAVARDKAWDNGLNAKVLQRMKDDPENLLRKFRAEPRMQAEVRNFYRHAAMIIAVGDPDSDRYELAQDIVKEMDKLYGKANMMKGMIKRDANRINRANLERRAPSNDQEAARAAEKTLKEQGWTIERDADGKAKTRLPQAD